MEAMREAWTDERLDDLTERMDRGFDRVDREIRELREDVDARFDKFEARFERLEAQLTTRFEWLWRLMLGSFVTLMLGGYFVGH
jgi:hypothetical protein